MSESATQFLIDLSRDPAAMDRFARDPEPVLAGAGLAEAERAVLRSGDPGEIQKYLGEALPRYIMASESQSQFPEPKTPKPPPPPPPGPPKVEKPRAK